MDLVNRDYKLFKNMLLKERNIDINEYEERFQYWKDYYEGIIDEMGIMYILASEFNFDIKKYDEMYVYKNISLADLFNHEKERVTVIGEIVAIIPPKFFTRGTTQSQIASVHIRNSNYCYKINFWGDNVELFSKTDFKINQFYRFSNVQVFLSEKEPNKLYLNVKSNSYINYVSLKNKKLITLVKEIEDIFKKTKQRQNFFTIKGVIVSIESNSDALQEVMFRDSTGGMFLKLWGNNCASLQFHIPSIVEIKNVGVSYDPDNIDHKIIGHINKKKYITIVK